MNKDEIIRMAREAFVDADIEGLTEPQALERFAALVAAHEREKLKNVAIFSRWYDELDKAVLAEREACVQACDITSMKVESYEFDLLQRRAYFKAIGDCGAAIRARGEK